MAVTTKVAVLWDEIHHVMWQIDTSILGEPAFSTFRIEVAGYSKCWKLLTRLHIITSFQCCLYVLNYVRGNTYLYSLRLLKSDTILFRLL